MVKYRQFVPLSPPICEFHFISFNFLYVTHGTCEWVRFKSSWAISSILCNFIHKVGLVHVTKFLIYTESFTCCVKLYQIHHVTNEEMFSSISSTFIPMENVCTTRQCSIRCVFFPYKFCYIFYPKFKEH
jgi:hypothetical protein